MRDIQNFVNILKPTIHTLWNKYNATDTVTESERVAYKCPVTLSERLMVVEKRLGNGYQAIPLTNNCPLADEKSRGKGKQEEEAVDRP